MQAFIPSFLSDIINKLGVLANMGNLRDFLKIGPEEIFWIFILAFFGVLLFFGG